MGIFKKIKKDVKKYDSSIDNENDVSHTERLLNSKEIIENNLLGLRFLGIGNVPDDDHSKLIEKYAGGFINAENGLLTLGVCVEHKGKFIYSKSSRVALAFTENKQLYMVIAKIEGIKEIQEKDLLEMKTQGNQESLKGHINDLLNILGTHRFVIVNLCILTKPEKHPERRDYMRLEVNWDLYFKIRGKNKELLAMQEVWIADKKFETRNEYLKLVTADISMGGFKSIHSTPIPKNTPIECIIEVDGEKINAEAIIVNCVVNPTDNSKFNIHAKFTKMAKKEIEMLAKKIIIE